MDWFFYSFFFFFIHKGVCHINGWRGTTRTIRELGRHRKDCQCSILSIKAAPTLTCLFLIQSTKATTTLKLNTSSSCTQLLSKHPRQPTSRALVLITARLNAAIALTGDHTPRNAPSVPMLVPSVSCVRASVHVPQLNSLLFFLLRATLVEVVCHALYKYATLKSFYNNTAMIDLCFPVLYLL